MMTTDTVPTWADLRLTARRAGPTEALALLHALAGPDTVVYGPAGHAIVPRHLADAARSRWSGGHARPRDTARETRLAPAALHGTGIVALRHDDGADGADAAAVTAPADADDAAAVGTDPDAYLPYLPWLTGLAWLRLGLSGRLLGESVGYLGERKADATPLLHQQLIRGALADVLIARMEIEAMLSAQATADTRTMAGLHDQITAADRETRRLLGASGFTAAGAGRLACLSELLADAYIPGRGAEP